MVASAGISRGLLGSTFGDQTDKIHVHTRKNIATIYAKRVNIHTNIHTHMDRRVHVYIKNIYTHTEAHTRW